MPVTVLGGYALAVVDRDDVVAGRYKPSWDAVPCAALSAVCPLPRSSVSALARTADRPAQVGSVGIRRREIMRLGVLRQSLVKMWPAERLERLRRAS